MTIHAVYFMCNITPKTAQDFRNNCLDAIKNGKASELLVHMSSTGGSLHEGFTLHNFLKSLPVKVTVNNAGSIESAAVIADLGSSVRVVSPVGRFVFHPWNLDFGAGPRFIPQVKEALHSLEIDQERYKTIFDKTTQAAKTPFDLSPSFNAAMIVNADSAIEHGIAQEIKEPATPSGAVLRWVNQF